MAERRPTNSELRLRRLESREPRPGEERGILELWPERDVDEHERDEDANAPLRRDDED
ncbi:MAG TPA: hypothetical protein VFJ77_09990 [Gaiellaceae bacterium]|nr:hypothetical protein [Gaiellaceae bacterium]